jgi:hypothetical protein
MAIFRFNLCDPGIRLRAKGVEPHPLKSWNEQIIAMKTLLLLALITFTPYFATSATVPEETDGDYIKVEIKGTLETGLMAIGGETTGTVVRVKNVTWELDFGSQEEFRALAAKLNKKTVLITGTYEKKKGVEVRERHIVKVATLRAAGEK